MDNDFAEVIFSQRRYPVKCTTMHCVIGDLGRHDGKSGTRKSALER